MIFLFVAHMRRKTDGIVVHMTTRNELPVIVVAQQGADPAANILHHHTNARAMEKVIGFGNDNLGVVIVKSYGPAVCNQTGWGNVDPA